MVLRFGVGGSVLVLVFVVLNADIGVVLEAGDLMVSAGFSCQLVYSCIRVLNLFGVLF